MEWVEKREGGGKGGRRGGGGWGEEEGEKQSEDTCTDTRKQTDKRRKGVYTEKDADATVSTFRSALNTHST